MASAAVVSNSRRPADSAFKQQTLKAWRPILTPRLVILLFAGVGIVFIPLGIAIVAASNQVIETETSDYNGDCCTTNCDSMQSWKRVDQNPCPIKITVPERMEPPIYMYYKLTNYYQNHRRYVRSRDDLQLRGRDGLTQNTVAELEKSCDYHYAINGSIINPCGLIAWSVFNDSFALTSDATGMPIPLDETEIAWKSDRDMKFHNSNDGTTGQNFPPFAYERSRTCSELTGTAAQQECVTQQGIYGPEVGWCYPGSGYCTEDQHFIIWMRSAGLPTFRKLYAKINQTLPAGTYTVSVSNGILGQNHAYLDAGGQPTTQSFLYPTATFGGSKHVVLSTASWIGGRNFFLGYAYITVGVVCVVLAICFFVKHRISPRDPGNAPYVSWQKDQPPK